MHSPSNHAGESDLTALIFAALEPGFTDHAALMNEADLFLSDTKASNPASEVARTMVLHAFEYGLMGSDSAHQNLKASVRAFRMMLALIALHHQQ